MDSDMYQYNTNTIVPIQYFINVKFPELHNCAWLCSQEIHNEIFKDKLIPKWFRGECAYMHTHTCVREREKEKGRQGENF